MAGLESPESDQLERILVSDYSEVIRSSHAQVFASSERITVLGRWVVLTAAFILNHFGNGNPRSSVVIIDGILAGWALANAVESVLLVRGFRPNRWFGYLTTAIDLLVATSILYFAGGYGARTDFSLFFYLLIIASAVRLSLPGALATALVVSLLYIVVGGLSGFPDVAPPPGFAIGRVFLFLFVALVAGLLMGDLRTRLDGALRSAIEQARALDETTRREMVERERSARLEEIDRVRSDFVSMVAHELQTPLASIKTQADTLLNRRHRLDPETERVLVDGIHRSASSLTELVQDFAAVNRIDHDQFTYHFQDLELGNLVREVAEGFPLDSGKHTLRLRVEPDLVVRGDAQRLRQALLNLVGNAVKYSPEGGQIAVLANRKGQDQAKVSVHDQGLGIQEEDLPRLFNKFSRLIDKRSMNIAGSGLGLYITKEIIQAHGGEIGVESEWGKGSTFFFVLPLKGSQQANSPQE